MCVVSSLFVSQVKSHFQHLILLCSVCLAFMCTFKPCSFFATNSHFSHLFFSISSVLYFSNISSCFLTCFSSFSNYSCSCKYSKSYFGNNNDVYIYIRLQFCGKISKKFTTQLQVAACLPGINRTLDLDFILISLI